MFYEKNKNRKKKRWLTGQTRLGPLQLTSYVGQIFFLWVENINPSHQKRRVIQVRPGRFDPFCHLYYSKTKLKSYGLRQYEQMDYFGQEMSFGLACEAHPFGSFITWIQMLTPKKKGIKIISICQHVRGLQL